MNKKLIFNFLSQPYVNESTENLREMRLRDKLFVLLMFNVRIMCVLSGGIKISGG